MQAQDVIDGYIDNTATLHWLWRLQNGDEQEWEGVSFDLFEVGNYSVRVYCKTKQQYATGWLAACWTMFAIRLALLILIEGLLVSTTIKCQETVSEEASVEMASIDADQDGVMSRAELENATADGNVTTKNDFDHLDTDHDDVAISQDKPAEEEVLFFECAGTWRIWLFLLVLDVIDFASILNPIVNPTDVQQGEYEWASKHLMMSDLLGFTSCKLELALVPSVITGVGRMLIGDDCTDMEVFLSQLCIFVLPIVSDKAWYGFEINTSTLLLLATLISVAVRFGLRLIDNLLFLRLY